MARDLSPLSPDVSALLEWLSLNGVHTEISDEAVSWLIQEPTSGDDYISEKEQNFSKTAPVPAVQASAASLPAVPSVDLSQIKNINDFNNYIKAWTGISLHRTASQPVIGSGQTDAPSIMVIAEAPDGVEDQHNQAFSAPAHRIIRTALAAAGFAPETLYCTYLSKWRPPGQRPLNPHEQSLLAPLLHHEIKMVRPRAILCLGESVSAVVLGDSYLQSPKKASIFELEIQDINSKVTVLTSQRGEFLVKTISMKKIFWFSLINFAEAFQSPGASRVNYAE